MNVSELLEELSLFDGSLLVFLPGFDALTRLNSVRTAHIVSLGPDGFGDDLYDEGGGEPNALLLEFDPEVGEEK